MLTIRPTTDANPRTMTSRRFCITSLLLVSHHGRLRDVHGAEDGVDGWNDGGEWHTHSRGNLRIRLTRRRARHRSSGTGREAHPREDRVDLSHGGRGVERIARWGGRGGQTDAGTLASRRRHHAHGKPGPAALEDRGKHKKENRNHEEQLDSRRASLPSSGPLPRTLAVFHEWSLATGPAGAGAGRRNDSSPKCPYETPGIVASTLVNAVVRPVVTGSTSAVPTTASTATQMVHSGSSAPASSRATYTRTFRSSFSIPFLSFTFGEINGSRSADRFVHALQSPARTRRVPCPT